MVRVDWSSDSYTGFAEGKWRRSKTVTVSLSQTSRDLNSVGFNASAVISVSAQICRHGTSRDSSLSIVLINTSGGASL